jgi:hypothetical protein
MAQPPPVRRRLVGSLLRQYREAHGFKLDLGWHALTREQTIARFRELATPSR